MGAPTSSDFAEGGGSGLNSAQVNALIQGQIDALPDLVAGDGIDIAGGEVSTQGPDVQDFSTVGTATYSPVAGAKGYLVYLLAGGGGGGAGAKNAEGVLRAGGCGGTSGGAVTAFIPASLVTGDITITIGDGGNGGASQTTNTSSGAAGSAGGDTSFGSLLVAKGGYGGVGGGTAVANRAFGNEPPSMWPVGISGLNGDNGSLLGPHQGGNGHAGGGSAGGYRTAGNANSFVNVGGKGTGGTGGASSGAAGGAGSSLWGGGGGAGGAAAATGTATAGGAGGAPSGGGGGGGAGVNTVGNSGAGGKGGKGFARVVAFR